MGTPIEKTFADSRERAVYWRTIAKLAQRELDHIKQTTEAAVSTSIRIGDFRLTSLSNGKVRIEVCGDGESGDFSEKKVESAIARFYADNF